GWPTASRRGRRRWRGCRSRGALLRLVAFHAVHLALAEQELHHLVGEIFAVLLVHGVQALLVDEHGLVAHPLAPRLLGDVLHHLPAEIARPGRRVEALGLLVEVHAVYG